MKLLLSVFLVLTLSARAQLPDVPAHIDHAPFDALLRRYVDEQGRVDYKRWKATPEDVESLKTYLAAFAPVPETAAEGDDLTASLINAYNAFTIELILDNYPVQSIRLLDNPFDGKRHTVGGQTISVDDIEHRMLRPLIGWKVHAVVVCAARSCPPLLNRAYTADTWEQHMEERYRAWLAREDLNQFQPARGRNGTVEISRIFRWYSGDYIDDHSVENILARFAPAAYRDWLAEGRFRIRYQAYDWGLNDPGDTGDKYRHNPLRGLF
ncbi:MAG: DUF547 domain-containing protein [Verrucomicrobia bacterium]|nr:DUF547 domain-containing protein [Verrucomicrobiota bacterium]MCH8527702.1 DUF547 domain-containing protein [Kiritimatiellia bacterium]